MVIHIRNKESFCANLIYLLFFIAVFTNQVFIQSGVLRNLCTVVISFVAIVYVLSKRNKKINVGILVCLILTATMGISMVFNSNADYGELLWPFAYLGIGMLLFYFDISYKCAKLLYYIVATYFLFCFAFNVDPNISLQGGSKNLVSVFLILYMSIYFFMLYREKKFFDVIPAILTFILSIWALGRTGIITSLFILIVTIIAILNQKDKHKFRNIVILAFIFIVGYWAFEVFFKDIYFEALYRFDREGLETGRILLISEYFDGLKSNVLNILFGVPFSNYKNLNWFQNPHNSFIMLHAKFGIAGFCIVIISILKWLLYKWKEKKYFEVCIAFAIIVRATFDWVAFPGIVDILFWYAFLEISQKGINKYEFK